MCTTSNVIVGLQITLCAQRLPYCNSKSTDYPVCTTSTVTVGLHQPSALKWGRANTTCPTAFLSSFLFGLCAIKRKMKTQKSKVVILVHNLAEFFPSTFTLFYWGCVCEQITNLVQLFLPNFSVVGALLKRGIMKRDPLQSPIEWTSITLFLSVCLRG